MTLGLLVGLLLPVLAVYLALRRLTPPAGIPHLVLSAGASAGIGLGLGGCVYYAWLLLSGDPRGFVTVDAAIWTTLCLGLILGRRPATATTSRASLFAPRLDRIGAVVLALFVSLLTASAAYFYLYSANEPHGSWDAWAIWNLKARFFFRGEAAWTDFLDPALGWFHQEYPSLLSSSVARLWSYGGGEWTIAPAIVAGVFTYGAVAVLVGSLAELRGWTTALGAGVVLLCIQGFSLHGASQTADVPLSFMMLTTVAFMGLGAQPGASARVYPALVGLGAGLAAMTKNEGTAFAGVAAAVVVASWWLSARRVRPVAGQAARLFAVLVPLAVLALTSKILAPPNPYIEALGSTETVGLLLDTSRHALIATTMALELWRWESPRLAGALPVLLGALALGGRIGAGHLRRSATAGLVVVLLMLCSYYLAYVMSPYDLVRHMSTSLSRILIQVWPLLVWGVFLSARPGSRLGANRAVA